MIYEREILRVFPVNAVCLKVVYMFVARNGAVLNSARTVFVHAKEEYIPRATITLTTNLEAVIVPSVRPLLGILIERMEEQVVKKPNVSRDVGIEAATRLQIQEKLFPLLTKAVSDIVPKSLDTGVVDTPST